jgi:hypothetical protein
MANPSNQSFDGVKQTFDDSVSAVYRVRDFGAAFGPPAMMRSS